MQHWMQRFKAVSACEEPVLAADVRDLWASLLAGSDHVPALGGGKEIEKLHYIFKNHKWSPATGTNTCTWFKVSHENTQDPGSE